MKHEVKGTDLILKKKIAIITLYDDMNFGNKLQNFAVQAYFESMGFEVVTLPYWEATHSIPSLRTITHEFAHHFLQKLGLEKKRVARNELREKRRKCIENFSDEYIKLGAMVRYSRIDEELKNQFDYFVTGSDQVWHSWGDNKKELEFFFLMFAKPEQRITMAPSFGFNTFPSKYIQIYKKGLEGFKYLSCRENEGKTLIDKMTGKEATVLLDPTMLIETELWLNMLRKPCDFLSDDYIFIYALGGLQGHLKENVYRLAEKKHWAVINIYDENSKYYTTTRPDEFLHWIHQAKLIVTDSFHAAVFSILFKKPFLVFLREDEKGMEDRLKTLLKKFSLNSRMYTESFHPYNSNTLFNDEKKLLTVDFTNVEKTIEMERKRAWEFYKKCFSNYG